MSRKPLLGFQVGKLLFVAFCLFCQNALGQAPVIQNTNVTVRVLASNLSSGNNQSYETPGLNILKGLKPDIIAIQEFNYGSDSAADIKFMVTNTFGTNFVYFRESGSECPA